MSYSSSGTTSSALYLFRSAFKTWKKVNEEAVQFMHPFSVYTHPYWWSVFTEVFQFIQYLSFGFEAIDVGTTFGYIFSLPRAFFKFGHNSYTALAWTIVAINIFLGLILFRVHWKYRTGLKQTKNSFAVRLLKLWVNVVMPVTYLPMLHILMRSVACNNKGNMVYWYDVDCWDGQTVPLLIGCIIAIPIIVCFGLIKQLTGIRFLVRTKEPFLTPFVYQPLFYMLSVTVFAILSESLKLGEGFARDVALSSVMIVCTGIMTIATVYRLPYIKLWDNCVRAAMHSTLCWFSICDLIGNLAHAERTLLIIFGATVIPIALLILKGCHFRATHLYWNKEVREFDNAFEIEIAIRVCYGSLDEEHVSFANDILQHASDRFPNFASTINIARSLMIVNQLNKSDHPALSGHIDRACKESRSPTEIYLAYILRSWKRHKFKKTGIEEDIKRQLRSAESASKKVLAKTRAFWKLLLQGGDLSTLGLNLVAEIEEADARAEKIYKYLISHYPHSSEVLRHYAQFLKEVRMDAETSRSMFDLADYVEDRNTKKTTSMLARENSTPADAMEEGEASTPKSKESEKSRVFRRKEKYRRKSDSFGSLSIPDDLGTRKYDQNGKRVTISAGEHISSDQEDMEEFPRDDHIQHNLERDRDRDVKYTNSDSVYSTRDTTQLGRYRNKITNSKSIAVRNMKIVIILTFIVLLCTLVLTFVAPLTLTNRHYIFLQNTPYVSGRTIFTIVTRLIREINIATTLGFDALAQRCRNELVPGINYLGVVLGHYTDKEYSSLQSTWGRNNLVIRDFVSITADRTFVYTNVTTNLYFAASEFANKARRLLNLTAADYTGKMNDTDFMWVVYNAPTTIIPALSQLSDNYAFEATKQLHNLQNALIYIIVGSGGFYLLMIAFFFIFPYRAINTERKDVMKLFVSIPRSTIRAIYDRLEVTEESGDDSDYERTTSFSLRLHDIDKYSKVKTSSMRDLSIRFIALIVALYALSIGVYVIFNTFVNNFGSIGYDITKGTTVRFKTQTLGFYSNELIFDHGPYSRAEIRKLMRSAILDSRVDEYDMDFHTDVTGGKSRLLRDDNYTALLTTLPATVIPKSEHNFFAPNDQLPPVRFYIYGLFDYLSQYWSWCEELVEAPDEDLSFEYFAYRQIGATIVSSELDSWLNWQITWLPEEYNRNLVQTKKIPIFLFVLGFVFLTVGILYIYPLTDKIALENARTTRMLLFIPLDIINRTPAIKEYLSSGQVADIRNNLKQSVAEQQQRTRTILEGTTDAVIIIDSKGGIDYFNNAAERLFEYRRDEAMKEGAYNVLPASLQVLFQSNSSDHLNGSANFQRNASYLRGSKGSRVSKSGTGTEIICKTRTGKEFPALFSFSNFASESQEEFTAVFVRDISDLVTQRKRADDVMRLILPASIAESLKRDPDRIIAQYYKSVTILFADICNFTELSSRIEAFPMVAQLNHLFSMWDLMVEKHHLEKIKTVGDAIMVVGGAPEEMENHAEAVFLFAQDMFVALKSFNMQYSQNWQIRIGINSGPAVGGVVGKKKITYDLWSDDVNIASRMESTAQPMHIQVSANTYELIKDKYQSSDIRTIDAKGKGKMVAYSFPHIV